ncbi:F-box protein At4g22390-like [Papaver somniferum]|uniref:F-box protein At4g22390-like n=1 Tax=Papaver somniferum TaxID=3469 RepID=UPI000E702044|nr:F-box protein At4g22390-like [Papaver somniferum]
MNKFNLLVSNHQRLLTEPHMFFVSHNVISSSTSQSLSSPFLGKAAGNGNPFMHRNHVRRKYCNCVPQTFGSCNGLVCIKPCHNISTICIWNRSTKEFKQVQATPIEYPPYASGDMESRGIRTSYGFGFDCKADDFKLLRIVGIKGECVSEARVYTLGLNSWKSLGFIPYTFYWYRERGLLVDGVLHWIAVQRIGSEAPPYVVSFDICDETFRYTPFPDKRFATHDMSFLGIWEGKLCLILYHDQDNDVV